MKKTYIIFSLCVVALLFSSLQKRSNTDVCLSENGERKSAGPPPCFAGEPTTNTTCDYSGCHEDFPLNSGHGQYTLNLGGADSGYIPGTTYTITLTLARNGMVRGGFELTALKDNDATTTPGTFIVTDSVRTQSSASSPNNHIMNGCSLQNKSWIEHTYYGIDNVSNGQIQWQFNWQAPASDAGSITFYAASIDADKSLDETGDTVYSLTKTISSLVSSIHEVKKDAAITLYPNPASTILSGETEKNVSLKIFSVDGKCLMNNIIVQNGKFSADVSSLAAGIYFLEAQSDEGLSVKKFVKE